MLPCPVRNFVGWRWVLCLLLGLALPFVFGGCSLLVAKHGTRPIRSLNIRSHRADVVAELGAPRQSVTFSTPVDAPAVMFSPADKATRRDEFVVSGLRTRSIGNANRWDWYPLECAVSLGTNEFATLPGTVREWTELARQRDRLRVWYDRHERVLTWEVRSPRELAGQKAEQERPFGWALRPPGT